jgi:hypothetical protein
MHRGTRSAILASPRWLVALWLPASTAWSQGEAPQLKADPELVHMAPVAIGGTGVVTVRITNRGRSDLKVLAKPSADVFTVTPTEATLRSNGTQELVVTFRPKAPGFLEARLNLMAAADPTSPLLNVPVMAVGRSTAATPLQADLLELSTESPGFRLSGRPGAVTGDLPSYRLTLIPGTAGGGQRIPIREDGGFEAQIESPSAQAMSLELRDLEGVLLGSQALRNVPSARLRQELIHIESVRGGNATVRGERDAVSTLTRYPQVLLRNVTRPGLFVEARVGDDGSLSGQIAAAPGDKLALLALGGGRLLAAIENLGFAPPYLHREADRWTLVGEPGAQYSLYLPAGSLVRTGMTGRLDGKGLARFVRPIAVTQDEWDRMKPVVLVTPRDGRPAPAPIVQ